MLAAGEGAFGMSLLCEEVPLDFKGTSILGLESSFRGAESREPRIFFGSAIFYPFFKNLKLSKLLKFSYLHTKSLESNREAYLFLKAKSNKEDPEEYKPEEHTEEPD